VLVPPVGVVNCISDQSVSRKVLSETVCAAAGADRAMTVAIADAHAVSLVKLALALRVVPIMVFSHGRLDKMHRVEIQDVGDPAPGRLRHLACVEL
jgi:hypothetical protein